MWKAYKYKGSYVNVYIRKINNNELIISFPPKRDDFKKDFDKKFKMKGYANVSEEGDTIHYIKNFGGDTNE